MKAVNPKPTIYTVSRLNREVKMLLNGHFFNIRVEGEISNLSTPTSGHIYFSMKDAKAQVRCAMFRAQQRQLKFVPENGKQIIVTAQVSLYETRGDYQLIVETMEEAGDGALRRSFEQLKAKLAAEGLFDPSCKKTLPALPEAIGVITSPSGAAIKDILSVIRRRFPAIPVIIYPVSVQGEPAKHEIAAAIAAANYRRECDVLLLTRGGGSLEDLWAFNEEIVARAIFSSELPIISGIGHEIDFTIADFVADYRAPTPSAAAEHLTPDQQQWLNKLEQFESRLVQLIKKKFSQLDNTLQWHAKRLQQQHPGKQLQTQAQRLDELNLRLNNAVSLKIQQSRAGIDTQTAKLWQHHPAEKIKPFTIQLHYVSQRLKSAIQYRLGQQRQQLAKSSQTLHAVSPLATLNRGYSIVSTQTGDEIVTSTVQVKKGDFISTRLSKGKIISQIEEIENA